MIIDHWSDKVRWGYRVMVSNENGDPYYRVVEVYYSAKPSGELLGWCETKPLGESLEILAKDVQRFQVALTLPVLTESDFPQ